jgi:type II secretory pathway predicted ATPase ExeA
MYETHFGLKKRLFRAHAHGNDVFIGPQSAATIAGIKKAMAAPDAIVAVSGPVGVGKTTLVYRALEGVGENRTVITVGRITLDHDEVLEFLLEELGMQDLPPGTVQRFALFRRKLKELADKRTRVFVVVEDASRVGANALSELEALTAADAGASEGAGIVLMDGPGIKDLLESPGLARTKQRLRLRQSVQPLSSNELLGYFKHSFRLAGGDFDSLFAPGCAELIHSLSEGIPRIANNLVESALTAAVEAKQERVAVERVRHVAEDEYGLKVDPSVATAALAPQPSKTSSPRPDAARKPADTPAAAAAGVPAPAAVAVADDAAASDAAGTSDEFEIPDLIQDTMPELAILPPQAGAPAKSRPSDRPVVAAPRSHAAGTVTAGAIKIPRAPAAAAGGTAAPAGQSATVAARPATNAGPDGPQTQTATPAPTDPAAEAPVKAHTEPADNEDLPTLTKAAGLDPDEIPAWDRDPTLAELRPDLEALEHAMKIAQGTAADEVPVAEPALPEKAPAALQAAPVPEITLDKQIQAKIEEAAEAIKLTEAKAAAKAAADAEAAKTIGLAASEAPAIELPAKSPPPKAAAAAAKPAPPQVVPRKTAPAPPAQPKSAPVTPAAPAGAVERRPAVPTAPDDKARQDSRKADAELEQIAANLARAKTIDDVDDRMAETLFGEEFSAIAAQVAAKAAAGKPANDDLGLAADSSAPRPSRPATTPAGLVTPSRRNGGSSPDPKLDESASRRLATVRALNGAPNVAPPPPPSAETIVMQDDTPRGNGSGSNGQPKPIEEQITTSMTQTLKALNVRPPADDDDDDDDDHKGGFFSRFRKS